MATKKRKAVKRKRKPAKKSVTISSPKKRKMAKRTSKSKTPRRRRRSSISGVGGGNMQQLAMIAGGALLGRIVSAKMGAKMNPKILAGVQVAAGIFLPKMMKNNKMVSGLATGLAVNGILSGLQSFGVIQGIAGMVGADDAQLEVLSGTDDLAILAGDDEGFGLVDEGIMSGTDRLDVVAGTWDEQLAGLEDDGMSGDDDY